MIEINNHQFNVIDVSSRLRLAIRSSMLYKIENFECGKNFIQMIEKYGDEIAALPLHVKKPLRFSFIVFPEGKEFGAALGLPIENGICGASLSLDDDYPLALQIDEHLFADGFCSAETIDRKVGLMHKLAHIVHGAYFQNMGCLGEGFAELLPHYLLDLDLDNERHCRAVLNLTESEM